MPPGCQRGPPCCSEVNKPSLKLTSLSKKKNKSTFKMQVTNSDSTTVYWRVCFFFLQKIMSTLYHLKFSGKRPQTLIGATSPAQLHPSRAQTSHTHTVSDHSRYHSWPQLTTINAASRISPRTTPKDLVLPQPCYYMRLYQFESVNHFTNRHSCQCVWWVFFHHCVCCTLSESLISVDYVLIKAVDLVAQGTVDSTHSHIYTHLFRGKAPQRALPGINWLLVQ